MIDLRWRCNRLPHLYLKLRIWLTSPSDDHAAPTLRRAWVRGLYSSEHAARRPSPASGAWRALHRGSGWRGPDPGAGLKLAVAARPSHAADTESLHGRAMPYRRQSTGRGVLPGPDDR